MLLRNVRFVGRVEEPVDVLLDGERIAAVDHGLPANGGAVVEGAGRWVIPGLWDKHVHLGQWASASRRIDLSHTASPDEALQRVRSALDDGAGADGRAVIGFGYRLASWEHAPAVADLDEVVGNRPVMLISGDSHNAWLSSAALARAELPARDGVLVEREWFEAFPRLARVLDLAPTREDYANVITAAHRLGVVGIVDLELEAGFRCWPERVSGLPPLRVRSGVYPEDVDSALAAGLRSGDPLGGLVTMGPLKVIVDGSLGTRTAYCCEPYAGTGSRGVLNYTEAELAGLLRRAVDGGLEVALHAIGDAAVDAVLRGIEATGARGSIEHAQLVRGADLPRMATMGLTASVQPAHLLDDRGIADDYWAGRTDRCFPLRSMLDAGLTLALGSDAPVAPLDPWLATDVAARRSADGEPPWHPEQAISRAEALAASVDGRQVAVGQPADLVLLDDDPLRVPRPSVSATFIAGARVF